MSIPLIMVVVFLAATLGISTYFSRRNTGTKEYFLAKGSLGIPLISALIFSEVIAGATTVGAASFAFNRGLSCVWTSWGQALGMIIFVVFVGKFYRAMNKAKGVMSVPEAYEYMFDRRSRLVMLFVGVLAYGIIFSTTPMAIASIMAPMLGMSIPAVVWISGCIFILMTLTGGLKGIAWMNALNSAILYVAMGVVAYKAVDAAGGIAAMRAAVSPTFFSVLQPDPMTALAGGLGTGIGSVAGAIYANVAFSGKTYRDVKIGLFFAACILIPFALLPGLTGIAGRVLMPDAQDTTILYHVANSFGPVYGGLAAMVAVAACFSTGPAFLLQMTTTVTRDFYAALIKKGASDREQLVFSKIAAVVLGVIFIFMGLQYSAILNQVLGAFQIRSVVGIVLMVAVLWPRVSPDAAFWSMLLGGIVAAFWHFADSPLGVAPLWPGAAATLVILIPVSLMSKEKVSAGYKLYQEMRAQADSVEGKLLNKESKRIMKTRQLKEAVILAYGRAPIGKGAKGSLKDTHPVDYAGQVLSAVVNKVPGLYPAQIEDVVVGCAKPEGVQGTNCGRLVAQRAGLPDCVPAQTLTRLCASGLQAIASAANSIMTGQAELLAAGGMESMSAIPMGVPPEFRNAWIRENKPGLYWPMGMTAEKVAEVHSISRAEMERFAVASHAKAAAARKAGAFAREIVPLRIKDEAGNDAVFQTDEGIREDTSLEKLASLKPSFSDDGRVTAGTASQVSDGAAFVVLASADKAAQLGVKPLARFVCYSVAGVPSEVMGIGPIHAIPKALALAGLAAADMDVIELNEAFAAQAIPCIRELGLDASKVNPRGGAIAMGHPLGATGAILVCKALSYLEDSGGRYGMISMCVGGGMGAAGIIERL